MKPLILLLLLTAPQAASAQAGPTFDCAKAESSAEKLVCADADLAALDRRLAGRFEAAVAVVLGLASGAKAAEDTLCATQRGWISGRDECWKDPDPAACVSTGYLSREAELVALYLLKPPVEVAEFACGDGRPRR